MTAKILTRYGELKKKKKKKRMKQRSKLMQLADRGAEEMEGQQLITTLVSCKVPSEGPSDQLRAKLPTIRQARSMRCGTLTPKTRIKELVKVRLVVGR
jgi:hypothetical protein